MTIFDLCVYILTWKNYKQPQDTNKPHSKKNLKGTENLIPGGLSVEMQIWVLQKGGPRNLV